MLQHAVLQFRLLQFLFQLLHPGFFGLTIAGRCGGKHGWFRRLIDDRLLSKYWHIFLGFCGYVGWTLSQRY